MNQKSKKIKVKIRQATIKDIPEILQIEKKAWGGKKAASEEMFVLRIKTFPEGTLVAEVKDRIVGVVVTEIVNYNPKKDTYTWYKITDNGFIKNSHNSHGDTIYGVDLSVNPLYQNLGIGTKLLECIGKLAICKNIKKGMLGGRIPNYYKYANKMSVEDYIRATINKNGKIKPLDPEIAFYKKSGLKIIKVIPDYFEDPESLNYGVLLLWENPFYNKWYRWLAAKLFRI